MIKLIQNYSAKKLLYNLCKKYKKAFIQILKNKKAQILKAKLFKNVIFKIKEIKIFKKLLQKIIWRIKMKKQIMKAIQFSLKQFFYI